MLRLPGALVQPEREPFMTGAFGKLFRAEVVFAICPGQVQDCVLKTVDRKAAKRLDAELDTTEETVVHYLLSRSGHHPNIAHCISFFFNDLNVLMLFEYASKGDLFDYIHTDEKSLPFIITHGQSLAKGLAFCHQNHIIHRDIKPENLLMFDNGPGRPPRLKICDFGLAKFVGATNGWCRGVCGTIDFMAPEVHLSDYIQKGYTFSVDMWSFGVIMFHMATALLPFGEATSVRDISRILQNPEYVYNFRPIANTLLRNMVAQLVTYQPENRLNVHQVLDHPFFQIPVSFNPDDFKIPSSSSFPPSSPLL